MGKKDKAAKAEAKEKGDAAAMDVDDAPGPSLPRHLQTTHEFMTCGPDVNYNVRGHVCTCICPCAQPRLHAMSLGCTLGGSWLRQVEPQRSPLACCAHVAAKRSALPMHTQWEHPCAAGAQPVEGRAVCGLHACTCW